MIKATKLPEIFVINLQKDVDKKQHMKKTLDKYKINYQFVNAVYGKELTNEFINKVYNENRALSEIGRIMTPSEIGCALSHIHIYKKMVAENIESAIVLEDDIKINKNIIEAIASINNFPEDWECVLLSYYRDTPTKKKYYFSYHNRIKVSKHFKIIRFIALMHSTAGYVINLSGAKKLLSHLDNGIYLPIDHYTGDEKYINLYGLHPRVIEIDTKFGFHSNLALERSLTRTHTTTIQNSKPDIVRDFLKKNGLFIFFKKLNLLRMELQKPITQIIYCILNIRKIFTSPKKYC